MDPGAGAETLRRPATTSSSGCEPTVGGYRAGGIEAEGCRASISRGKYSLKRISLKQTSARPQSSCEEFHWVLAYCGTQDVC